MPARPWWLSLLALLPPHGARAPEALAGVPRYTVDGALLRPPDLERWVLVGASTGLAYGGGSPSSARASSTRSTSSPPRSRRGGRRAAFPTVPCWRWSSAPRRGPGPPGRAGWVAGELGAVEVAVKDTARFPGGWAYFGFGRSGAGMPARAFPPERCAHCHAEHAALDNVFLQFYPVLREARPGGGVR